MKKTLIYILIIILSVSLVSCGGNNTADSVTDNATVADQTTAVTESDTVTEAQTETETETATETETENETATETETETEAVTETETETETDTEAETTAAASGEKDPNTWLCKSGGPFPTGWWMGPVIDPNVENWSIDVNFITPNAFDGFVMACYAGAAPSAILRISLLDNYGEELEAQDLEIIGDHENDANGFVQVSFSKAYSKGTYTIRFDFDEGSYFVLGSAEEGDVDVSVAGNAGTNENTLPAPAIALYGAVAP